MKTFVLKAVIICTSFILIGLYIFLPGVTKALTPLDKDEMAKPLPARMEEIEEKEKALPPIPKDEFESSICFKRCHKPDDFSPSQKTRKQWVLLIESEGHAVFEKIPWESPEQKDRVLVFLLRHARDKGDIEEGIGLWD